MVAYQYKGKVYYRALVDIPAGSELLVWYGDEYAAELFGHAKFARTPEVLKSEKKPFSCPRCSLSFRLKTRFRRHWLKAHSRPFLCSKCPTLFLRMHHLKEHESRHPRLKLFVCELCMKGFDSSFDLKRHRDIHKPEKSHICKTCGKAYTWESSLKAHERTHSGLMPFCCHICDKGFMWQNSLEKHMASHKRLAEDPVNYQCSFCQRSFGKKKAEYERHLRKHTKEKPFKCDHCGNSFAFKHQLTRHMDKRH